MRFNCVRDLTGYVIAANPIEVSGANVFHKSVHNRTGRIMAKPTYLNGTAQYEYRSILKACAIMVVGIGGIKHQPNLLIRVQNQ